MTATAARRPGGRAFDRERTLLRAPDLSDARLMRRRAWWLGVLHLLLPGAVQVLAGSRRLGRAALRVWLGFWAFLVLVLLLMWLFPQAPLTVLTTGVGLTIVQIVLWAWFAFWAWLTLDAIRLIRPARVIGAARIAVPVLLVVALVLGLGGTSLASGITNTARATFAKVFPSTRFELPADGRYSILLLGGDAGAGRSGDRPDSISVISFNAMTGSAVTFGLPRNLTDVPFVAGSPMHKLYPNGYGYNDTCNVDVCELNSIYTEVQLKNPGLYPNAAKTNSSPGMEAMRDAAEGILGIRIQYVAMINMGAMEQVIDAMGGVTIDVTERLPVGGGVDANGNLTGVHRWIEKGVQHMNGNTALWYARSRHSTSDYDRMLRQHQLEQAILTQLTPVIVLTRFDALASAASGAVKTDIPQSLIGWIAGLAVRSRGQTKTVQFTPPLIRYPGSATASTYVFIRQQVQKALG